ncbi:ferredoxin [Streptomyces sp. NPDC055078]
MKITLDRGKCTGLGMCEALAPDFFEIDEDGELVLLKEDASDGDLDAVRQAIEACPTEALRLAP